MRALLFCALILVLPAMAQVPPIPDRKPEPDRALLPPERTFTPGSIDPNQLEIGRRTPGPLQMPPAVRVKSYRDAYNSQSRIHQAWPFELKLEFTDLEPGPVRLLVDPTAHRTGTVSLPSERAIPPGGYQPVDVVHQVLADGSLQATVQVLVDLSHPLADARFDLHLLVERNATPRSARRMLVANLPVVPMKLHVSPVPADMKEKMQLDQWRGAEGYPIRNMGCNGPPTVMSRPDVGVFTDGGKLRVRARSGPLGTRCIWESIGRPSLRYPWRAVAMNLSSSVSQADRCKVESPVHSRYVDSEDQLQLRAGRLDFGDPKGVRALPAMLFALSCVGTLFDDQFVELSWNNVELIGPRDASTDTAW